jgi:hypothetical protein
MSTHSPLLIIGLFFLASVLGEYVVTDDQLYLQIGEDFPAVVKLRVTSLLQQSSQLAVVEISPNDPIPSSATSGVLISLGSTLYTSKYIDQTDLIQLVILLNTTISP